MNIFTAIMARTVSLPGIVLQSLLVIPLCATASTEVIHQDQKLTSSLTVAGDQFGSSVAHDGDTALVGAPELVSSGPGQVYLYGYNAGFGWDETGALTASDGQPGDAYGFSVDLSGDTAAVSAVNNDNGTVYLYNRDADGTWIEKEIYSWWEGSDQLGFGFSLGLSGHRLAIGSYRVSAAGDTPGAVSIVERAADGSWSSPATITASDGALGDHFGFSLGLDGDLLAVGAHRDDHVGEDAGSVYLFTLGPDNTWIQVAKLTADDAAAGDWFGYSVSVSGSRVLVGARADDDLGALAGAAYLFEKTAPDSWTQVAKLRASDGLAGDAFGFDVQLNGSRALVGAPATDHDGASSGNAYLFERLADGRWVETGILRATDAESADQVGLRMSLQDDTALVGAIGDDDRGNAAGAVHVFDMADCPADIVGGKPGHGDGVVNVLDLLEVLARFGSPGPIGDIDSDGMVGVSDILAVIEGWGACS